MKLILGYACLNTTIPLKMKTLRLATYLAKGDEYLKGLVLDNLAYVKACLEWNLDHQVVFFRVSSDLVPLATHPQMTFRWWQDPEVSARCEDIRQLAVTHQMRLTMHPGQYTLLNSPRKDVVERSLEDLDYHRLVAEKLGVTDLITHVGGLYGDRESAIQRWIHQYQALPAGIQQRLRLENDEKLFAISDVLAISHKTGVPAVLDFHHHRILPSMDLPEAVREAAQTWQGTGNPKFHLSSGKSSPLDRRHDDWIHESDFRHVVELLATALGKSNAPVYLMLEAKLKEQALLRLQPMLSSQR